MLNSLANSPLSTEQWFLSNKQKSPTGASHSKTNSSKLNITRGGPQKILPSRFYKHAAVRINIGIIFAARNCLLHACRLLCLTLTARQRKISIFSVMFFYNRQRNSLIREQKYMICYGLYYR